MRTRLLIGLVVGAALIWQPRPAQTVAAIDPAEEQFAYVSVYPVPCGGASTGDPCPPNFGADPKLVDADDRTHDIPLPYTRSRYAWSPDGRSVLTVRDDEIYVSPATGAPSVNLTNLPGAWDGSPAWSPDGNRIAFVSNRDGAYRLYVMTTDGSAVVRLNLPMQHAWAPAWSPDGARLAFTCIVDPATPANVCAVAADGSGLVQLTSEGSNGEPDWSPDGQTILFSTGRYGGSDLAVMNADGSNVRRVTPAGVVAFSPSWNSDGTRIVFVDNTNYDNDGWSSVALINTDGTGLTHVGLGDSPSWRPWSGGVNDRPHASFTFECNEGACTFDASSSSDSDGSIASYGWVIDYVRTAGVTASHTFALGQTYGAVLVVMDTGGALAASGQVVDLNQNPVVAFVPTCNGLTCTFDGSATHDPDGTLAMIMWSFGDGAGSGPLTTTHSYAVAGTYTVTLTAYDTRGDSASYSQTITVVRVTEPLASFTFSCIALTCDFDASSSSDPNGDIVSYAWYFGDGAEGVGKTVSHTYTNTSGMISVRLTVTDASGSTSSVWQIVTVSPPEPVHVGDLDGTSSGPQTWTATATVTIHNNSHAPVANAAVSGYWSDGSGAASCTTDADGRCSVRSSRISRSRTSVRLSITNVTRPGFVFNATANHDADGDSTGGSITIIKP